MGRHPGTWYDDAERLARTGDWNLTEIGQYFGVTRERVRQILKERGIQIDKATGQRLATEHRLGAKVEEIVAYANEHGARAAAEKYDCTAGWVRSQPSYEPQPHWAWFSGISDEELRWMHVELGWSTPQISRVVGLAQGGVSQRLRRMGVARPKGSYGGGEPAHDPARAEKICRLIREGLANRQIAEEAEVSARTVQYWREKVARYDPE